MRMNSKGSSTLHLNRNPNNFNYNEQLKAETYHETHIYTYNYNVLMYLKVYNIYLRFCAYQLFNS